MGYEIDDLVWAKLGKSPYWPARIIQPDSNVKEPTKKKEEAYQFVVFFGSNDVAWIRNDHIFPHSEDVFQTKMPKRLTKGFKFAVEDFKSYLALPLGIPSPIVKEREENKIKHSREPVKNQDQGSPKRKVMRVVKVIETGPKKRERNVLSQKSRFKKVSKKQRINVNGESGEDSPSTSDEFYTSGDISFGRRHSLEEGEFSKIATIARKHSIEQDLTLVNFPVSNGYIAEIDQSLDDSNHTGTSDMMDISDQSVLSFVEKYGFIGLNGLGRRVLRKFIKYGMEITLWDDVNKYEEFTTMEKKVEIALSPAELIHKCDITFCCYDSDTDGFKNIINGPNGILKGFEEAEKVGRRPGYVGLGPVDRKTSKQIQEKITTKNGMYLDAPLTGYIGETDTRKMVINAAGDRNLFFDCEKCFKTILNDFFFLGYDIDINANTNMLYNTVSSTTVTAIAEATILTEKLKLFDNSTISAVLPAMMEMNAIPDKVDQMGDFYSEPITPLRKVQRDISLVLNLADILFQEVPMSTAANDLYKHAKLLKYSDSDVSAIYNAIKQ